eukprot:6214508-Pleurochrysis_carterae.AAC.7
MPKREGYARKDAPYSSDGGQESYHSYNVSNSDAQFAEQWSVPAICICMSSYQTGCRCSSELGLEMGRRLVAACAGSGS